MARIALIEKEKQKQKIVNKYREQREEIKKTLKTLYKDVEANFDLIFEYHSKLQQFPRKSIPARLRNRCRITGRARGVYRKVGLSRMKFREYAMNGLIPGVVKSSW